MKIKEMFFVIASVTVLGMVISGCTGGGAASSILPDSDFTVKLVSGSESLSPQIQTGTTETVTFPVASFNAYSSNSLSGKVIKANIRYYDGITQLNSTVSPTYLNALPVPYEYSINSSIDSYSKDNATVFTMDVYRNDIYNYIVNGDTNPVNDRLSVRADIEFILTDSLDRFVSSQSCSIKLSPSATAQ